MVRIPDSGATAMADLEPMMVDLDLIYSAELVHGH